MFSQFLSMLALEQGTSAGKAQFTEKELENQVYYEGCMVDQHPDLVALMV